MVAIGIDLGTTNSCFAVVKDGQPEILVNDVSERTTPSVVSIVNEVIKVGKEAKALLCQKTEYVAYGVKYLIGSKFDDKIVQDKIKQFNFPVLSHNNKTKIKINNELHTPEEISGILLKHLKKYAENDLKEEVDKAVITVPAYFNDSQRQATSDAGKIAGFKEIKILDEPTAAAIAYGVDNEYKDGRTILVYDFGGGTFDVSIVKYQNKDYDVLAIEGDLNLGGDDIDMLLLNYFKDLLQTKKKNVNWSSRNLARLRKICESAKTTLTDTNSTEVDLYMLLDPDDDDEEVSVDITVDILNKLCKDLFKKTIDKLNECLTNSSNVSKDQIDCILLVGGSTRLTGIKACLNQYFDKEIKQNINPDEAVALGAAIVAAKWEGSAFQDLSINTINSYSLGIRVKGDQMSVIIPKHSKIPLQKVKEYKTISARSSVAKINIFSGENKDIKKNNFLGELVVEGISKGPTGNTVTVTFHIDEDGILRVSAKDQSGKSSHLNITLDKGNLTNIEIQELSDKIKTKIEDSNNAIKKKLEKN